jgi:hypothetical protein
LQKSRRSAAAHRDPYIWRLPTEEAPGTLAEIFAAEDTRRQHLVLYAFLEVDGFRRCWTAIGAPGDPDGLIDAVMTCISSHLNPLDRLADHRRRMRLTAKRVHAAAMALEKLSSSMDELEQLAWHSRLKDAGLPDPTDPRVIGELQNVARGLGAMLAGGALNDKDGRPKMAAFERLIQSLVSTFENATGQRAGVTDSRHSEPPRYEGRFWELVEIVLPIAADIIAKSGELPLAQPATPLARGRFIERVLSPPHKTPAG